MLALPYVSLVQEKVRDLSTLASELGLKVEEFAGSKQGGLTPSQEKKTLSICLHNCEGQLSNECIAGRERL